MHFFPHSLTKYIFNWFGLKKKKNPPSTNWYDPDWYKQRRREKERGERSSSRTQVKSVDLIIPNEKCSRPGEVLCLGPGIQT